jgi:hypothetical protein
LERLRTVNLLVKHELNGKAINKGYNKPLGSFRVSVDNGRIVSTKPIDIDPEPSDIALNVPCCGASQVAYRPALYPQRLVRGKP